jgi:hypothetical protein
MASALPIADVFKGENVLRLHGNLMEHPCTKVRALTQVAPQRATSMPCLTLWIAAWRVHFSVYQRPHRAAIDSFRSGSGADIPVQRVGAETQLWPVAGAESAILRVRTQLQAHPRLVAWRACADCNRSRAANPHSLLSLQAARIAILTAATVVIPAPHRPAALVGEQPRRFRSGRQSSEPHERALSCRRFRRVSSSDASRMARACASL